MDVIKYRKLYLSENWGENRFQIFNTAYGRIHPLVLSGKAYWINKDELCIGYKLDTNSEIYRPIFSNKRQGLLDKINELMVKPKFWNKIRTKYFNYLYKMKVVLNEKESIILPVLCIENIIKFTISPLTFDYLV